jgi:hypothetical protein
MADGYSRWYIASSPSQNTLMHISPLTSGAQDVGLYSLVEVQCRDGPGQAVQERFVYQLRFEVYSFTTRWKLSRWGVRG